MNIWDKIDMKAVLSIVSLAKQTMLLPMLINCRDPMQCFLNGTESACVAQFSRQKQAKLLF